MNKDLLIVIIIILTGLMGGCGFTGIKAYVPPPVRYTNLQESIDGTPVKGTNMSARDAHDVLSIQERYRALQFERELTESIGQPQEQITATGIPGVIRNRSRYYTINFYVVGPTTKSFTLFPGEILRAELPPGQYTCHFLRGSYEVSRPWTFQADWDKDFYYGEWVNWGLHYDRN